MLTLKERFQMVLMFVIMTGNTLYMISPLYFIYLDSWIKNTKPHFSYSLLFMMYNLMDIGIPLFNWVSHKLIPLIGTKSLMVFGGPMFALSCLGFYYSGHIGILVGANLMVGMTHQLFVVVIMEILTKKHPDHYMGYVGKIFSAYSLNQAVWTVLSDWVMNPNNEPTSRMSMIDGHPEYYYSKTVTSRFPFLLWALMGYGIFTTSLLGLFLSDPTFAGSMLYKKMFGKSRNLESSESLLLKWEKQNLSKSRIHGPIKLSVGFRSFYHVRNDGILDLESKKESRMSFSSVRSKDYENLIQLNELSKVGFVFEYFLAYMLNIMENLFTY